MEPATEDYLQLTIQFDPRRVNVGFRNDNQAFQYERLISMRAFTTAMKLDPQRRGRFVSIRLPSRVTDIEASTTYSGFTLCIDDLEFARQWEDALIVWKFASSRNQLYIQRDIDNRYLNQLLDICESPPRVSFQSPEIARAQVAPRSTYTAPPFVYNWRENVAAGEPLRGQRVRARYVE
ncbi:hypothetical protein SAMD00023353_1501310 [Rosellinia necatrix]|uniref:Uncharacterized protein n=1 Tax=Rosellinia necatrix TaxID=77044 RepID=A0A1W2TIU5_ROSNE|nr:hypothetical protein SAMD00023353_1501310 [Rosellinia necatrix]